MAVYPDDIVNLRRTKDRDLAIGELGDIVIADDNNLMADEVEAIENALGTNPEGDYPTTKENILDLQDKHANANCASNLILGNQLLGETQTNENETFELITHEQRIAQIFAPEENSRFGGFSLKLRRQDYNGQPVDDDLDFGIYLAKEDPSNLGYYIPDFSTPKLGSAWKAGMSLSETFEEVFFQFNTLPFLEKDVKYAIVINRNWFPGETVNGKYEFTLQNNDPNPGDYDRGNMASSPSIVWTSLTTKDLYFTTSAGKKNFEYPLFQADWDFKIWDSSRGLILKDRSTGASYRLYIDSGALQIETE